MTDPRPSRVPQQMGGDARSPRRLVEGARGLEVELSPANRRSQQPRPSAPWTRSGPSADAKSAGFSPGWRIYAAMVAVSRFVVRIEIAHPSGDCRSTDAGRGYICCFAERGGYFFSWADPSACPVALHCIALGGAAMRFPRSYGSQWLMCEVGSVDSRMTRYVRSTPSIHHCRRRARLAPLRGGSVRSVRTYILYIHL